MPIYDYDCTSCGHGFELRKSWSEGPVAMCPLCGAQARKKFAIPTIVYKGSGFYTTDNRSSYGSGGSGSSGGTDSGNVTDKNKPPSSGNGKVGENKSAEKKENSGSVKDNTSANKGGNGTDKSG